jgi:hypothetical protein
LIAVAVAVAVAVAGGGIEQVVWRREKVKFIG